MVANLQGGISEGIGNSDSGQAWTKATNHDPVVATITAEDKARDHNAVTGTDHGPRADVTQFAGTCLAKVVNFKQRRARAVTLASDNGGIGSGVQRDINRGFEIVRRLETGGHDRRFLGRDVSPVVVCEGDKSAWTVQLQDWVR